MMVCYLKSRTNCFWFVSELEYDFLSSYAVFNAGIAGCCTGLALSFPGITFFFSTHGTA